MPSIPGGAIVVLGVIAALAVYLLVWRATSGRSALVKTMVRGSLALLLLAPIAFVTFVGNLQHASQSAPERWPQSLGAERDGEIAAAAREDRLPAEENGGPASAEIPQESMPPAAANGGADHKEHTPVERPGAELGAAPTDLRPSATDLPDSGIAGDMTPADRGMSAATRSALPQEDKDWDVVPVFFGTDRQEEPNPKRLVYNSERGRRLELGRAMVTVPKIHQIPQLERPWAVRIPYFNVTIYEEAEDPKKHFTMQEIKKLTKEELVAEVRKRLDKSERYKDHAIVFVHGYNTSFDHAVYRTAQISYDLKFDGAAFLYSWPSGGAVASYTYDRESAGASIPYLRQFLELVVQQTGAKAISIIAHSMGNQPLLEVLKDMRPLTPEGVAISQIICAAPDVDADNFANLARQIEGFAKGVTLYAASNDRALIISRNFWQHPRAGDVTAAGPLIVPGVDSIDVTAASTDAFALHHSGYAENNALLQDIGTLILSGLRPPDQRLANLKRVTTVNGDYWRFAAP